MSVATVIWIPPGYHGCILSGLKGSAYPALKTSCDRTIIWISFFSQKLSVVLEDHFRPEPRCINSRPTTISLDSNRGKAITADVQ